MSRVEGYGAYQNNYYEMAQVNKKETGDAKAASKAQETKAAETNPVELSEDAKNLLEELKKKYGNMDFMVAKYSSDEEAKEYLNRGTKEYSVLIDPETLEKMAADEETKNKYLSQLDDATGQLKEMEEKLGEDGENVKSLGITIGSDGTTKYFAELEKSNANQKERLEKSREARKEQKAAQEEKIKEARTEKKEADVKRTSVSADSAEELLKKIKDVDWDKIKSEKVSVGGYFDFSI